jgi:aspartate/tyrosine/aromatic aminotransferase
MQENLQCVIPDGINEVIERAKEIAVYHARAGYLLAIAKKEVMKKELSEISKTVVELAKAGELTKTAQNKLAKNVAYDEAYLANWLDEISKMCVHQIDLIRSIISKEKEEIKYLHLQT